MARPPSWLSRLHPIRQAVANSVRSHYDRKDLERLFELQPRGAGKLLELLTTVPVGTAHLVEREVLVSFLEGVQQADDVAELFQQLRQAKITQSRRRLRSLVRRLNRSTFMGHLGADAKQDAANKPVTFAVAVSSHWNDNLGDPRTRTDWQNIVVFGNLRKYAATLKKGDRVYIEAEARNNNYERKIGAETVKFHETEFLAAAIERVAVRGETEAEK